MSDTGIQNRSYISTSSKDACFIYDDTSVPDSLANIIMFNSIEVETASETYCETKKIENYNIENEITLNLSNRDFEYFINVIENPPKINENLRNLLRRYDK